MMPPPPLPPNSLRIVVNDPVKKLNMSTASSTSHWSSFLQSPDRPVPTSSSSRGFCRSPDRVIPPPRRHDRPPPPPLISHATDSRASSGHLPQHFEDVEDSADRHSFGSYDTKKEQLLQQYPHLVSSRIVEPLEQLVIAERLAKLRSVTAHDQFDGREEVLVQLMSALELLLTTSVTSAILLGKHAEDVETRAALANTVLATVKQALYFDRCRADVDRTEEAPRDSAFRIRFSELPPDELPSSSALNKKKWSLLTFKAALRDSEQQCQSLKNEYERSQEKNRVLEKLLSQHRSALGSFGQSRAGGGPANDPDNMAADEEAQQPSKHLLLFQAATFGAPTTAITLDTSFVQPGGLQQPPTGRRLRTSSGGKGPGEATSPQQPKLFLPPADDDFNDISVLSNAHAKGTSSLSLQRSGDIAVQLGDHQSHTIDVVLRDNKQLHKRCRVQAEQLDVLRAQITQQERQLQMLEKAVTDVTMENYELSLQIKTLLGRGPTPQYSPMLLDGRSAEMIATQSNLEIAKLLGLSAEQLNTLRTTTGSTTSTAASETTRRRSSTRVPSVELLS